MYCPMKFNSKTLDDLGYMDEEQAYEPCQCEKEKCAWWVEQPVYRDNKKIQDGVCTVKYFGLRFDKIDIY